MIREAEKKDLNKILELYTFLHDDSATRIDTRLKNIWDQIMNDPNHHIIVADHNNQIISSCVCVVVPNLSRSARPYALIENVVTEGGHRRQGYAGACLDFAKEIAISEGCYKMMLLTGHKDAGTLNLYRKAGYNSEDKTAFIQWL
jgi:GNAT superfamily N-acetyltransferase